jgi:hypothetical protein
MKLTSGAALALALAGCGTPQQLPVEIARCDAVRTGQNITLTASVVSRASKPISGISLTADFYRDFRSVSVQATAPVKPELDPGQQRNIAFLAAAPGQAQGRAMRCFATRLSYLDGTSENAAR